MNLAPTDIILVGSIAIGALLASVSVVLTLQTVRARNNDNPARREKHV